MQSPSSPSRNSQDMSPEDVSAREALLKWAQRTTEGYPGVEVKNFSTSWKDGLAFNAILHRNRPDLFEFRSLKSKNAKSNLESAFCMAEKEFGVTRLLDIEDVDTAEPDEKSLMTYILSLYDVFPDPPNHNPFAGDEKNRKKEEYMDLSKSLLSWMQCTKATFMIQTPLSDPIEIKNALSECSKCRSDELPKRLRDKQKLSQLYKELEKSSHNTIQRDLRIEELEKNWDHTTTALQDQEQKMQDELSRLEKLQCFADKFIRDSKLCVEKLESIEKRLFQEHKQSDIKQKCDQLKKEFKFIDDTLERLHKDILIFQEKRYSQTPELQSRLKSLNERYERMKEAFQHGSTLFIEQSEKIIVEKSYSTTKTGQKASEFTINQDRTTELTVKHDKISELSVKPSVKEHFDWIEKKYKRIQMLEFGNDVHTIKRNLDQIKAEQKTVDQYKKKISSSNIPRKDNENEPSCEDIDRLQSKFNVLITSSNQKQQEMQNLLDFVQSAIKELKWMNTTEETEITRDWSAKNLNINALEHYQETLTSDLEKREPQLNAVQNQGESLLLQNHPASKCVEDYLSKLQEQWSWLLQLTFCLEVHIKYIQGYRKFFKEAQDAEQWLKKIEEKLNTTFNKTTFSIDEGESYLKQMDTMKIEIRKYEDLISSFEKIASEIVPLKQRRSQPVQPIPIVAICNYKSSNIIISKDERCFLKEISNNRNWKVLTSSGKEVVIPSVCFAIPPPNPEAILLAESLKKQYYNLLTLWTQRQKKLRQNLVFTTIKAVKSWNLPHMRSLDVAQRESIITALNSDALKLINEGMDSEPARLKLKQEMEQCNALFNSLRKKMPEAQKIIFNSSTDGKSSKISEKKLADTILGLQTTLNEKEKFIKSKLHAQIQWDLDVLEGLVLEHKNFDMQLRELEDQVNNAVQDFKSSNKKNSALQMKYDTFVRTWNRIWQLSNSYVEKLKTVEVGLHHFNEVAQIVSNIEVKLASCKNLSTELQDLQSVHRNLLSIQEDMQTSQSTIDDAQESSRKLKELMVKIRTKQANHADCNKFENDLKKLLGRWDCAKSQIVERLRSCGASYELLQTYKNKVEKDNLWISETTVKLNSLKTVKKMTTREIEMTVEPSMNLYSSILEKSFDETKTLGAKYIREAKMAVQENFKVCEDNTTQLKLWMGDVEDKLSEIGFIQCHLPTLQLQICTVKVLKEELESKQSLITTCLDQMRNLAQRGLEVLNKEEIHYLQKNLISLQGHYDLLSNTCNIFLRSLTSAFEELQKYRSEVESLKIWINEAQQEFKKIRLGLGDLIGLESKSEHIRTFTSGVIAHQADLRFVTIAAERFIYESKEFLKPLNTFRTNLSKKLPEMKAKESEIKEEVEEVTIVFNKLLNEVIKLSDNYACIIRRYRSYSEIAEKAQKWLSIIKKSSKRSLEELIADDPSAIQEQLNEVNMINMEVVGQGRLVESIYQAWKTLADTLETCFVNPKDSKSIEMTIHSLQDEYSELHDSIACRIRELQIAFIHSQDILSALERLMKWLEEAETKSLHNEPISLKIEKLNLQVNECKILKSDLNNQRQNIELLKSTNTNSKLAKKVEVKLKDLSQRFDKLSEKIFKRCQLLDKVMESVHAFEEMVKQFDAFCVSAFERMESTDDINIIIFILNERNSKKEVFDQISKVAKDLTQLKQVSDFHMINDQIQHIELQWKRLGDSLSEKKHLLTEQVGTFDTLRVKLLDWFAKVEKHLEKPLAVDLIILNKQGLETTELLKEHSEYSVTLEKMSFVGNSCNTLGKASHSNLSPIQQQLNEINDRYTLLRSKLSERNETISFTTEEIKSFYSIIEMLHTYVDAKQKQLSKEGTSFSKKTTDNKLNIIKEIEKEMLEKQSSIDNLKVKHHNILSKGKGAKGSTDLQQEMENVEKKWIALSTSIHESINFLQNLKERQDLQQSIRNWLTQKDKMFQVLGPIALEPRLLLSQVQQIQVLRDEFTYQSSIVARLNELGTSEADIQQQWKDLSQKLLDREKKLETTSVHSKQFHKLQDDVKEQLHTLTDRFESYQGKEMKLEILLKKLIELEEELDKLRPQLADVFSVCEQLCEIISDSSSKTEIKYKVSILEKSYTTLRKRIDHYKAEVQASLKEDKMFFKACEEVLSWLNTTESSLFQAGKISGNISKLSHQIEEYEVFYKKILNKEHEIYLCLSKGSDMMNKTTNKQVVSSIKEKLECIKKEYEKIKKTAIDRHTSLHSCFEYCKKYQVAINTFIPWLQEKEEFIKRFKFVSLKRQSLNKQLKEVQIVKSELSNYNQDFHNIEQFGSIILSHCDSVTTKKQIDELKSKWKRLNNAVCTKVQYLEDLSLLMFEYDEIFQDVQHKLQRLEDKMCPHVSYDSVCLNRLKIMLQECTILKDEINKLKKFSKTVVEKAGENSVEVLKNLEDTENRHNALKLKFEEQYSFISASYKVISMFKEQVKTLLTELSSLDECFDNMSPIARDLKILKNQLNETKELQSNLLQTRKKFVSSKQMSEQDHIANSKVDMEQMNHINRQMTRLEDLVNTRATTLESIITRIGCFHSLYSETDKQIQSLLKKPMNSGETIHVQQSKLKNMQSSEIAPLSKQIAEVNKIGHGLVQSAANSVDTSDIERKIDYINNTWNNLQESINEREKKLDVALLQSGKFQDALNGVQKWIEDTEQLVSNQQVPSFDVKVVKGQVEEQKFIKKMLADRLSSVRSLKVMGTEIMSTTKTQEDEKLLKSITSRFDKLSSTSEKRMTTLETIMPVAQEFQSVYIPLTTWVETAEKRLHTISSVPIEESRIAATIKEQKKLSSEIAEHGTHLKQLNTISEKLKKLADSTDSVCLQQKIQLVNEKYRSIKCSSENMNSLLNEAQKALGSFNTKYTKVLSLIDETTHQLTQFQVLSIYSKKLQKQHKDLQNLKEKLNAEKKIVDEVVETGVKIMKLSPGEDPIQMKEKLEVLSNKLSEVSENINERLKAIETYLPLIDSFYSSYNKLTSWMDLLENSLKTFDSGSLNIQKENIKKMEEGVFEYQSVLNSMINDGSHLSQLSSREGATVIENQVSQVNQRFEKLGEQVKRKSERIQQCLQRKFEVINDIDELSDWFQDVERQINDTEGPSSDSISLSTLLTEQKALCEDVNGHIHRVRDVVITAKRLMRESSSDDVLKNKMSQLQSHSSRVSSLSQERLTRLEDAFALSQHFYETHSHLEKWLNEMKHSNKDLAQSLQENKPLLDKLNKTAVSLMKLCKDTESHKIELIVESDNSRYNELRKILREHQNALEEALQATSKFSDQFTGIFNALTSTADQLENAEPISVHPKKIKEQINDNNVVLQDLNKRVVTFDTVKKAAEDVVRKASTIDEAAVKDIQLKVERLDYLWLTVQTAAQKRGESLKEALIAAEDFWNELSSVMKAINNLQSNLKSQKSPAIEPSAVQHQQQILLEIKQDIFQTEPQVVHCRQAGQHLMHLCGESEKSDVQKHIEDLDSVWDNVTTLYAKREQNLIDAMDKAMIFHETLQNLIQFLDTSEDKLSAFGDISFDIDSVKERMNQLKNFKMGVDPHMIEIEAINRQAKELMELASSDESIRKTLININRRWDHLLKNIIERQKEMENALLKLGEFQHALDEHLSWISKIEKSLLELKPIYGDPQIIEIVLAKLKVIHYDIQAHQSSIDALNRAGHEFLNFDCGSEEAKFTQNKLLTLQKKWLLLQEKSSEQYRELEEALKEAKHLQQDIQDLLSWLNEVDGHLVNTKPIGGLPETAREQINKFMDLFNELDTNRYKVEDLLQQGQTYLNKGDENNTKTLQHSLNVLKQKWDSVLTKASDRKIKLEIALRETLEFHEAFQNFVDWLTNTEKYLNGLKPVSRSMKTVLEQIEEHRTFQKDLGVHREVMLTLEKKGTHLKYSSRKQDVLVIQNLLISGQHRWEKIVSRAAQRTRALDQGYKEAKQFHDAYVALSLWLDSAEKILDDTTPIGNDPVKIKKLISKHREFQRTLTSKQSLYDSTIKSGRILKGTDANVLDELKMRWNQVCSKSVLRQRQLEEALLFSGQFREAVLALMEWLDKTIALLSETKPYHGDLDTVTSLIEQHKRFEEELKNKESGLDYISKTSIDLKKQASASDVESISSQIEELKEKWKRVNNLNEKKRLQLSQALQQAEELSKNVHPLLEWLSESEMKLRFFGSLHEDEEATEKEIVAHDNFLGSMAEKEQVKIETIELAQHIHQKCHPDAVAVIRQWITILNSRWDEVFLWAQQRGQRLRDHLLFLKDIHDRIEKLLSWLKNAESTLTCLEAQPLPEDMTVLDGLIQEHQVFMHDMSNKQNDVDRISKALKQTKGMKDSAPPNSIRHQKESDIKHPKAKALLEKWRAVWLLAMERQRRLQDGRKYILELRRIKHFDFNEWRKRYLLWLNNDKSRVVEQFKKIDNNNTGRITKQEFIEGILQSKFATRRLEMEKVADIFDKNGDGFIDTKEYLETLYPQREPQTEAEKIQDEVERQVAKCTCIHPFKVYQVGEGKYRFGDSQKLRLVRILRSTVMVRVGGGWVALDEFLVKNDPCRAKGRTNLDLREQFILADGVSQSMTPFKPKTSSDSGSLPSAGPITKIREKSERSTPMSSSAENNSDAVGSSLSSGSLKQSSRHSPQSSARYKSSSSRIIRQSSQLSSQIPGELSRDVLESRTKPTQIAGNGIKLNFTNSDSHTKKILPELSKIPSVTKSSKQPHDLSKKMEVQN